MTFDPIVDLELKLQDLKSTVALNDQKAMSLITSALEDVNEIKSEMSKYVRVDNFSFYERVFWILATAVLTMLGGGIYAILNGRAGG